MIIDLASILISLFVLFAWSRALLRFKDNSISAKEFVGWTGVWVLVITLIFFRDKLYLLNRITPQRPIDIILVGSVVVLFYGLFRIYVKLDKMEQDTTKIVRELAKRKK